MATPSNSNWPTGYIPTAAEWAQSQSAKVDYPAPLNQGGTGATDAPTANYGLQQRGVIATTPYAALPLNSYGLHTSVSALIVNLPALNSLQLGDWIDLYDMDFHAGTNNITITAAGADLINLFGTTSASQTLNIDGAKCKLVVGVTNWSMIV